MLTAIFFEYLNDLTRNVALAKIKLKKKTKIMNKFIMYSVDKKTMNYTRIETKCHKANVYISHAMMGISYLKLKGEYEIGEQIIIKCKFYNDD